MLAVLDRWSCAFSAIVRYPSCLLPPGSAIHHAHHITHPLLAQAERQTVVVSYSLLHTVLGRQSGTIRYDAIIRYGAVLCDVM